MAEIERVLRLARDRMADPDRVVSDPLSFFEEEDGTSTHDPRLAVRACVLGHVELAALEVGGADPDPDEPPYLYWDAKGPVVDAAREFGFGAHPDPATAALAAGCHLDVLDIAIEMARESSEFDQTCP